MPFNWKTPYGYFIAYVIVSCAAYCTFYCAYWVLCFLIGSCWLFVTIAEDITNDLKQLNINEDKVSHESRQKLQRRIIINIVRLHVDATQLSRFKSIESKRILWQLYNIYNIECVVSVMLFEHYNTSFIHQFQAC